MGSSQGLLPRLRTRLFGARDEVAEQMREIAHQGSGMARIAHLCGFLMIILFSLGSAVGIGSSLVESLAKTGVSLASAPDAIALSVSVMLVLCMDVGSLYASFMVRMLATRRAQRGAYGWHIAIIVVAACLESGTFAYMSWKYDLPTEGVVWALIIGRAVAAPLFAIYLNMARRIPVGVEDMLYRVELNSGMGVIRGTVMIANDPYAEVDRGKLGQSIEMYRAAAVYSKEAGERLDKVAALFQDTQPSRIAELPAPEFPGRSSDESTSDDDAIIYLGRDGNEDRREAARQRREQAEAVAPVQRTVRANKTPKRGGRTNPKPSYSEEAAIAYAREYAAAHGGEMPSNTEMKQHFGMGSLSTGSKYVRIAERGMTQSEQLEEIEA